MEQKTKKPISKSLIKRLHIIYSAQGIDDEQKRAIHGNCEIKRISVRRDNNEYKNFRKQICGNVWPDYRR